MNTYTVAVRHDGLPEKFYPVTCDESDLVKAVNVVIDDHFKGFSCIQYTEAAELLRSTITAIDMARGKR